MRFTDLEDEELKYCLKKVRWIAEMDDETALPELDELLASITSKLSPSPFSITADDDHRFEFEEAERHLEDVERMLKRERGHLEKGKYYWGNVEHLRSYAEDFLGAGYEFKIPEIEEKYGARVEELRGKLMDTADEIERGSALQKVDNANEGQINDIRSVRKMLRELEEAESFFEQAELMTDELERRVRSGRERCAWYKANKKLQKAQVALAGGRFKYAHRMRREAEVELAQTWEKVFPGEEAPEVKLKGQPAG